MPVSGFSLPKLSATMDEGVIVRWLKAPGDTVSPGEPLVEVETDKAIMEVESPVRGRLAAVLVPEGESVPVGTRIAEIETDDGEQGETTDGKAPSERRPVSPAARRRARELGVDLAAVKGTGPGGRITLADVEQPASTNRLRQGIIETVSQSHRDIPTFWVERWVDLENVLAFKSQLDQAKQRQEGSIKTTLTDFLAQAVADTVPSHPRLLTRLVSTDPLQEAIAPAVALGLVVSVPGGVVVPTLGDLAGRGLGEIASLRSEAVAAARSARLSGSMLAPAPISLSNVGPTGADVLRPMILPGQTAILGVGRAHERVVPQGRAIAIRTGCSVVLAADHRVVDGMDAAAFLGDLAERIEKGAWRP